MWNAHAKPTSSETLPSTSPLHPELPAAKVLDHNTVPDPIQSLTPLSLNTLVGTADAPERRVLDLSCDLLREATYVTWYNQDIPQGRKTPPSLPS